MNKRALIRTIFIFITLIISFIFMFITSENYSLTLTNTLLFIFLTAELIFIKLNNNHKYKNVIIFLSILNLVLFICGISSIIIEYTKFNYYSLDYSIIYLFFIFITFISSIMDIKKDSNKLNDILFIIVSLLIILIYSRYYFAPRFIHNLLDLDMNSVILQNSFKYICQYYFIFSIILFVLLIHKKISNIKSKSL